MWRSQCRGDLHLVCSSLGTCEPVREPDTERRASWGVRGSGSVQAGEDREVRAWSQALLGT